MTEGRRHPRGLAAALVFLVTVVAFETMSVATIMPEVRSDLGGLALYGWAFSGLALGEVVGIVFAGYWADRANPVRPIVFGLVVYTLGLVVSGAAGSMTVVVIGRVLQGYGAGTVPAIAYVCVGRGFAEDERARVFAWMATAWVVPSLIGPAAAGVIAHQFGWRWVFLGLIPIVVGVGALAVAPIKRLGRPDDRAEPSTALDDERPLRVIRLALVAVAGTGLALGGMQASAVVIAAACVVVGGASLAWAFARITPPGTLRLRPGLPAAVAARGMLTFAFLGADAFVALALTDVRHTSTRFAGMVLSSAAITWTAGSWISARSIASAGPRRLVSIGMMVVVAGIVAMSVVVSTSVSPWFAVGAWLLGGLGVGLAYSPLSQAVIAAAEPAQLGAATAALQLSDVLGVALGSGLGGALVAIADRREVRIDGSTVQAGVTMVWVITAAMGLFGIVAASRMSRYLPNAERTRSAQA